MERGTLLFRPSLWVSTATCREDEASTMMLISFYSSESWKMKFPLKIMVRYLIILRGLLWELLDLLEFYIMVIPHHRISHFVYVYTSNIPVAFSIIDHPRSMKNDTHQENRQQPAVGIEVKNKRGSADLNFPFLK